MDFNHRAIGVTPPPPPPTQSLYTAFPPPPPSPAIAVYSDRLLRGEFLNMVSMPLTNAVAGDSVRELEKAQIRREMIASGVARRIQLEAEVRRELALEALLGILPMQRGNLSESVQLRPPPPPPPPPPRRSLVEERVAMSLNNPLNSTFAPPKSQQLQQLMAPVKIEPCPEETSKKDKVIILDKPNPALHSGKQKAVIPPLDEHRKPKEVWSCALCQVSAPNQGVFSAHLQGRKHKAKEASLRQQNNSKSTDTSVSSKRRKSNEFTASIAATISRSNAEADQQVKNLNMVDTARVESKKGEQPEQNRQNIEPLKNKNGTSDQAERRNALKKIHAKFWCETCQVGVWAEAVMEDHLKGKKHLNQMKKLGANHSSSASSDITRSSCQFDQR
ncbi:uncharacterized protein LOC130972967 [Arachis stenosperma]|uniref:uncharacterized protein LOC130972967 n=1 Tax=Arachis stenosperma TaxID=217475 RepID=UPI0025ACBE49|nr:uncharacterized protein LOC130972967 [Arachis stenosperma]